MPLRAVAYIHTYQLIVNKKGIVCWPISLSLPKLSLCVCSYSKHQAYDLLGLCQLQVAHVNDAHMNGALQKILWAPRFFHLL